MDNISVRYPRTTRAKTLCVSPRVVGTFPDGNSVRMLVCARLRHIAGKTWGAKR